MSGDEDIFGSDNSDSEIALQLEELRFDDSPIKYSSKTTVMTFAEFLERLENFPVSAKIDAKFLINIHYSLLFGIAAECILRGTENLELSLTFFIKAWQMLYENAKTLDKQKHTFLNILAGLAYEMRGPEAILLEVLLLPLPNDITDRAEKRAEKFVDKKLQPPTSHKDVLHPNPFDSHAKLVNLMEGLNKKISSFILGSQKQPEAGLSQKLKAKPNFLNDSEFREIVLLNEAETVDSEIKKLLASAVLEFCRQNSATNSKSREPSRPVSVSMFPIGDDADSEGENKGDIFISNTVDTDQEYETIPLEEPVDRRAEYHLTVTLNDKSPGHFGQMEFITKPEADHQKIVFQALCGVLEHIRLEGTSRQAVELVQIIEKMSALCKADNPLHVELKKCLDATLTIRQSFDSQFKTPSAEWYKLIIFLIKCNDLETLRALPESLFKFKVFLEYQDFTLADLALFFGHHDVYTYFTALQNAHNENEVPGNNVIPPTFSISPLELAKIVLPSKDQNQTTEQNALETNVRESLVMRREYLRLTGKESNAAPGIIFSLLASSINEATKMELLLKLILAGATIHAADLWFAAKQKMIEPFTLLSEHITQEALLVTINTEMKWDSKKRPLLYQLTKNNNVEYVKILSDMCELRRFSAVFQQLHHDPKNKGKGKTAIFKAVQKQNLPMVEALSAGGAGLFTSCKGNSTSAYSAAINNADYAAPGSAKKTADSICTALEEIKASALEYYPHLKK